MAPLARMRAAARPLVTGLPRPFWFLWAGTFVTRCGSFVLPFLALYLTQSLGLSFAEAGLVCALYGVGLAVAGPLGGYLADRFGRRVVLVTSLGLGGAGMIALGSVHRVALIAPGVFLLALVTEMYRPAMQAAVADLVAPADRVRAFGLVYWVINLGFAIGLTLGGLVASHSFYLLFVGDGVTTLAFAALIAVGVPETRPPARVPAPHERPRGVVSEFFAPFRDGPFVLFIVLGFLFAVLFMQNATTFAVDMTEHGVSKVVYGRVLALNGALIALIQPFLGPALAKRNTSRAMAIGSAVVGAGFGLNAVARSAWPYAAGVVVWTLGEMAVLPLANARVAALSPMALRGRYQGAYSLAFGLGVCAAPALGMLVLDRLGSVALWSGCFAIGVTVALGHIALGRVLARAQRRHEETVGA